MKKTLYTFEQRNYIILLLTIVTGIFLLHSLIPIFPAILGAIVMYTLFRSWNTFFVVKKKFKRWLSALLIIIISFFILVLPVILLIFMVVNKAGEFMADPSAFQEIYDSINAYTDNVLNQPNLLKDMVTKVQSGIFQMFSNVLSSAFDIFLQVTVMYFILYFMLAQYEQMEKALYQYTPFRPQATHLFSRELRDITFSNVIGQGIIAVIQGILLGIGFLIFGIEGAFFWGVVTIFLSFLPVIGSPIVFIPAGVIAISSGNTGGGIGLLIYGLVLIINIDNVIRLAIAKKVGNIHPLITIVGVVIGIPMFGILGLIYGPLLLSFFFLLIRVYETNQKEIRRNEDNETELKNQAL
jgi:predicted PurR-regulated permease PerM